MSVVLPASGWEMMAKVRRRETGEPSVMLASVFEPSVMEPAIVLLGGRPGLAAAPLRQNGPGAFALAEAGRCPT
ncbi:hypothetical protein GCM10007036_37500 [Alsobacter metallidurans]|uniref:Uncharacterized protein n=1 Tax=Alsobacter metallidurans TaxID=340221 RepID=A0A917IAP0_9HYPH|nr:hypothetical protein GCM10007036_37500 [Alsobacter metallidurans]